MKITRSQLKEMIREEISSLNEKQSKWKSKEHQEIHYAIWNIRDNLKYLPSKEVRRIQKDLDHLAKVNIEYGTEEV